MSAYREPEVVEIARRTMDRLRASYHETNPYERDAWRLAQHVLAEYDRQVLARWSQQDRVLTLHLNIDEIEIAMSRDPDGLVESLLHQARRSLTNQLHLRRSAGEIANKIRGIEAGGADVS